MLLKAAMQTTWLDSIAFSVFVVILVEFDKSETSRLVYIWPEIEYGAYVQKKKYLVPGTKTYLLKKYLVIKVPVDKTSW